MCGIAGEFHYKPSSAGADLQALTRVRDRMLCRGPDGCGLWSAADRTVALAHRRLAILDLSDNGAQPMKTPDGSVIIAFNGEIFNFIEMREELIRKGFRFNSNSDTEVLLALYRDRGMNFLAELRGMFAFALWDSEKSELILARDLFGIKPLYYFDSGEALYFASQVRALLEYKQVPRHLDPVAQCGFFFNWFDPGAPHTFSSIRAVGPGQYVRVKRGGALQVKEFDSVEAQFKRRDRPIESSLRATIEDSVRRHLLSDAPCGFFLSAGLDSSTLVGCAAQIGHPAIKTVTLGFDRLRGTPADETILAERIARLYGTDHQTVWISREDFLTEMNPFWAAMDQPSIDGINSYFVSKAARAAGLTVALSGLGADELFGGYPSFKNIPRSVRWLRWASGLPSTGKFFSKLSMPIFSALTSPKYSGMLRAGGSYSGAYLLRRGLYLPEELPSILDPQTIRSGLEGFCSLYLDESHLPPDLTPWQNVSLLELTRYMRNQLLRDADWASMAHSLEVRVPFVDPEVLRLAVGRSTGGKPLTKQELPAILEKPLPTEILDRPKTGFTVPVRDWLLEGQPHYAQYRGLRGWARVVYERYLSDCGVPLREVR